MIEKLVMLVIGAIISGMVGMIMFLLRNMSGKMDKLGDMLNKLTANTVTHDTCSKRMQKHFNDLDKIKDVQQDHSERIVRLEARSEK